MLERWQPEHVLERRQPEHLQERQSEHVLERGQPEYVLGRRQPEHLQERRQPGPVLERRQPEHVLGRRQPEHLQERRQPGPVLEWRQPKHLLKDIQLQQLSQQLFQERRFERVEQKQYLCILQELRRKHPEMEGLKSSGIDAKQLDLSKYKSEVLIVADNGQQHEELPSQQQITTHEKFRLAMQGLIDMFAKLRILSIIVQTPERSYGVWLLI